MVGDEGRYTEVKAPCIRAFPGIGLHLTLSEPARYPLKRGLQPHRSVQHILLEQEGEVICFRYVSPGCEWR